VRRLSRRIGDQLLMIGRLDWKEVREGFPLK